MRIALSNRFLCNHSDYRHFTHETVLLYESLHFDGPGEANHIPMNGERTLCRTMGGWGHL